MLRAVDGQSDAAVEPQCGVLEVLVVPVGRSDPVQVEELVVSSRHRGGHLYLEERGFQLLEVGIGERRGPILQRQVDCHARCIDGIG